MVANLYLLQIETVGLWEKIVNTSLALAIAVVVCVVMFRFFKQLRADDKKESLLEKEEILANIDKKDVQINVLLQSKENIVKHMTDKFSQTVTTVQSSQLSQIQSIRDEIKKMREEHKETIKEKDKEILVAYQNNVLSAQNINNLIKEVLDNQAKMQHDTMKIFNEMLVETEKRMKEHFRK